MEENTESTFLPLSSKGEAESRPHNAGGALVSAMLPGAGQFILGEMLKGGVFLALFVIWGLLRALPLAEVLRRLDIANLLRASSPHRGVRSGPPVAARRKTPRRVGLACCTLPLGLIVPLVLQAIFMMSSGFETFRVPSESMEPTIQNGDKIVADMRFCRHHRLADGDLVLFRSPETPGVIMVKRLIAKGGETILSIDGNVSINGKHLEEPYVEHTGPPSDGLMNFGPLTIPPHKLFFMGDNRDVSLDSRTPDFGLIDESSILGKPLYVYSTAHNRAGERLH